MKNIYGCDNVTTISKENSVISSRRQSGNFHVYIRGNSKFVVFLNDEDYIKFLIRSNTAAKDYNTRIGAFALMDNHAHLHVVTDCLTAFMRSLLIGYTRCYNKRKGLADKLFKTPFGSSFIYSQELISENLLYILSNPIKAGICSNPWEYKWSSYHFHNKDKKNPLSAYIDIDTSIVESSFSNKRILDSAICSFNADITKSRKSYWPVTPDYEVIKHMNTILAGRNLFTLTKAELNSLVIRLRKEDNATYRQIATITHEGYEEVRRICQFF